MSSVTFDTLDYFEKLMTAGFTEAQARVQVEAMQGVVKQYDDASRRKLTTEGDLAEAKHEILKWMMGMLVAQTAMILTAIAFIR